MSNRSIRCSYCGVDEHSGHCAKCWKPFKGAIRACSVCDKKAEPVNEPPAESDPFGVLDVETENTHCPEFGASADEELNKLGMEVWRQLRRGKLDPSKETAQGLAKWLNLPKASTPGTPFDLDRSKKF